jgi:hypothetical protein
VECERGRGHGNCSALARVGGGGVADSPPVPRHRGRWAGDAPESGAEGPRRGNGRAPRHSPCRRLLGAGAGPRGSSRRKSASPAGVYPTCCAATSSSRRGCAEAKGEPRPRFRGEGARQRRALPQSPLSRPSGRRTNAERLRWGVLSALTKNGVCGAFVASASSAPSTPSTVGTSSTSAGDTPSRPCLIQLEAVGSATAHGPGRSADASISPLPVAAILRNTHGPSGHPEE